MMRYAPCSLDGEEMDDKAIVKKLYQQKIDGRSNWLTACEVAAYGDAAARTAIDRLRVFLRNCIFRVFVVFCQPMKIVPVPAKESRMHAIRVDNAAYGCTILSRRLQKAIVCFFLITAASYFLHANAQTSNSRRKENFDVQKFRETTIDMPVPGIIHSLSNIYGVTVIDARADTASIGLMQKKVIDPLLGALNNAERNQTEQRINKTPTFITLESGLQQEAAKFAAGCFSFPHNKNLPGILMVIKKLWLTDELNLTEQAGSNTAFAGTDYRDVWTSGVDVKIEFYLQDREPYYPLYRYDSIISKAVTVSEYAAEFVALAIRLSLQRMPQMDAKIAGIMKRKQFSLEEISRHNAEAFNLPVLKDSMLVKGVYMNFEEFKNNQPSQTDYDLKKDKLTDIIYIKQAGGTEYAARHVWGYCDGVHTFIRSANNFFLLQRSGNAFYIFGAKYIKRNETKTNSSGSYYSNGNGAAVPVTYSNSKTFVQLEPFQLDWSTGKLY